MSERKVDVLAVLDKHIKAERSLGYEAAAREGEEASAAVADLYEALIMARNLLEKTSSAYFDDVGKGSLRSTVIAALKRSESRGLE